MLKYIMPFMFVMIVMIFAFGNAYWLIGRNQMQFDLLESEECVINENCSDSYEE